MAGKRIETCSDGPLLAHFGQQFGARRGLCAGTIFHCLASLCIKKAPVVTSTRHKRCTYTLQYESREILSRRVSYFREMISVGEVYSQGKQNNPDVFSR